MSSLFSYTIPIDDGAAPNPFHGICTLAICKPMIRRIAKRGDWVVGLGSKSVRSGNLSKRLVYAMRISEVLSLQEYDALAPRRWPHRIPKVRSRDLSERLGDCIYDFSGPRPRQRPGVHGPRNIDTDLSGLNALISNHFYYFGSRAIPLPRELYGICHQTQGHKSDANKPFLDLFKEWLTSLHLEPGQLYGWPDYIVDWKSRRGAGCTARWTDGESDGTCE